MFLLHLLTFFHCLLKLRAWTMLTDCKKNLDLIRTTVLLNYCPCNPACIMSWWDALKWLSVTKTSIKHTLHDFLCFLLAYVSDA